MKKLAASAFALAPLAAFAAAPDVSALETEIEGVLTPVGVIGLAVLSVIVGIKLFKWIRRAM